MRPSSPPQAPPHPNPPLNTRTAHSWSFACRHLHHLPPQNSPHPANTHHHTHALPTLPHPNGGAPSPPPLLHLPRTNIATKTASTLIHATLQPASSPPLPARPLAQRKSAQPVCCCCCAVLCCAPFLPHCPSGPSRSPASCRPRQQRALSVLLLRKPPQAQCRSPWPSGWGEAEFAAPLQPAGELLHFHLQRLRVRWGMVADFAGGLRGGPGWPGRLFVGGKSVPQATTAAQAAGMLGRWWCSVLQWSEG